MPGMNLTEIIPWGRSYDEYQRMFALPPADLAASILGCGDGPASFNAEATQAGYSVISCDPIYEFSASEIKQRVEDCYDTVIAQVMQERQHFVWDYFRDPEHLGECRLAAMRRFLADYKFGQQESRYVVASLPKLPFPSHRFTLALVSHLLFLYSNHLDFEFHFDACRELLRVAKEVRIFPLLGLNRKLSPHVERIIEPLETSGVTVEIVEVDYEFQKAEGHAGRRMMRLTRRPNRDAAALRVIVA
jgi:hypothetical protein